MSGPGASPERYDGTAARHYSAFRPPLHAPILERALEPGRSFQVGLDVGCGTGASALALARRCQRVVGLEPSHAMLEAAESHPGVTYVLGSGDALPPLPVSAFDVVSFAGSLFYAKSERLRRELQRVCAPGAILVAYDFEVLLDDVLSELGVTSPAVASGYDHRAGIQDWPDFALEVSGVEPVTLEVTSAELAHLLLSDSNRCDGLSKRWVVDDPFELLTGRLGGAARRHTLRVETYFGRWRWMGV